MEPENKQDFRTILINHLPLLIIAILLASGLYLYFRSTTTAMAGVIVLLVAHAAAVLGVILMARGRLASAFRKLSGWLSTSENQE